MTSAAVEPRRVKVGDWVRLPRRIGVGQVRAVGSSPSLGVTLTLFDSERRERIIPAAHATWPCTRCLRRAQDGAGAPPQMCARCKEPVT